MITYVADIDTGQTNSAVVPHTLNHLVDDLAGVGLSANLHLEPVEPALGILAGRTVDGDVWATTTGQLLQLADNGLLAGNAEAELLEVDEVQLLGMLSGPMVLEEGKPWLGIDEDNLAGTLPQSEDAHHLTNGATAKNCDGVTGIHGSILDGVVSSREHVGKVEGLLIGNVVGDLEHVGIGQGHTDVLGLTTGETAGQVGVAKDAGGAAAVHGLGLGVGVGDLALGRELVLAEEAVAAGNLERNDIALADLDLLDAGADLIDNTAELVAEDVALVHLHDGTVVEMEVRAADGGAGDLEDDIVWFDNLGLGDIDDSDLLGALPDEGLHEVGRVAGLGAVVVGDVLLDLFGAIADKLLDAVS